MKLTPAQAAHKIQVELAKGNGAYIDTRFYKVRVKAGVLQVSYDFANWVAVTPGSEFRSYFGTVLFTYEPDHSYKRLIVTETVKVVHPEWLEAFEVGEHIEVVRETAQFFIIAPMGFDQKVSKATLRISGLRKSCVKFKIPVPPIKPFAKGDWHVWQGTASVMLSNEESKQLQEFATADDCINWLFQFGCKETARALHAHVKGE